MTEVKRSTEHSLELGNITIKIDAPGDEEIKIHTKEPGYSNYMRIMVEDIGTLTSALTAFQAWLKEQPKTQDAETA
jgi:hypothetical protein